MKQRTVSVLGDSVSTYEGCNPPEYSVFYHAYEIERNGLTGWEDTWWARVIRWMHAQPLIIDAYSGSRASGGAFPSASCEARLHNLRTAEQSPDVILVYIGFNDFGYGVPLQRGRFQRTPDLAVFADAYAHLLHRLRTLYPDAWLLCGTLMRTRLRGEPEWKTPERFDGESLDAFNGVIRACCKKEACILADLAQTGMRYETLDGTHPTSLGHQTFAETWIACLMQQDFPGVMIRRELMQRNDR